MVTIRERPRGRLAPSPTGALHLGNARSFLIAWLSVRSRGGSLVLRMEDLDHPKVKPGASAAVLEDLRWLGMDWNEGPDVGGACAPYVQSERIAGYAGALQRLQQAGRVYPCVCTRRDVEQGQAAPHLDEAAPRYDGACAGRFADYESALRVRLATAGETAVTSPNLLPAWRFRAWGETHFVDEFRGRQQGNVAATEGDFVLARHPRGAGYMLAVVVDDAAMGINEVVRGDDLLPATHQQLLIYQALGLAPPRFCHVPLVVGEEGRRLAKRHGDTRLSTLRQRGLAPEAVVGLLAWWSGWAEWGEVLSPRALLPRFDLGKLPKEPAVLDARVKRRLGI
jgi:glutamyl-tRNA synthetase